MKYVSGEGEASSEMKIRRITPKPGFRSERFIFCPELAAKFCVDNGMPIDFNSQMLKTCLIREFQSQVNVHVIGNIPTGAPHPPNVTPAEEIVGSF